jgi:hypothetical protein
VNPGRHRNIDPGTPCFLLPSSSPGFNRRLVAYPPSSPDQHAPWLPLHSFESVTTASVLSRLVQPVMAAPDGLVSNLRGRLSGRSPQYSAIPSQEADGDESLQSSQQRRRSRGPWGERRRCPLVLVVAFALIFALLIFVVAFGYVLGLSCHI